MKVPKIIKIIAKTLAAQNAKTIIVGGSVRDHFLGIECKDYDVEVYGLAYMEELETVLAKYGSVNLVGKNFGVLKFSYEGDEYDFSFPRKEIKTGEYHNDFDVSVDGFLDFETASRRRDFTLNALGYDVMKKIFLDPFNGLKDIKKKQLRHIDDDTFVEDALRVYRAIQFTARFGFTLHTHTFLLCKNMVLNGLLDTLAKERIFEEWKKLLLKSKEPSIGFELMRKLGIIQRYFPELYAIIGVPQSPKWHPEGDVWIHTMMCLDKMVTLLDVDAAYNLKMMFAILCHDLGKATHTSESEKGIQAIGHDKAGLIPSKSLLYRLMNEHSFIESILPFVEHHLKPSIFYRDGAKASAIRRLATKINIEELIIVAKADFLGRTTEESLAGEYIAGEWLLKRSKELKVETKPLCNLVQGRDLIALGMKPSQKFKEILDSVYTLQIEGTIMTKEEALLFVKNTYI